MNKYVFFLVLILAGCETNKDVITNNKLQKMSNAEICRTMHSHPSDLSVLYFMRVRKLSCHPATDTCKEAGVKEQTKEFAACVSALLDHMFDREAERTKIPAAAR
jgi:hypothetical protein